MVTEIIEEEIQLDLLEFEIEGDLNNYFAIKGPIRIRIQWADEKHTVMRLMRHKYVVAIFTAFDQSLYRVAALDLHWAIIRSSFRKRYENMVIYE